MSILAVVPARGGSKSIPRKNLLSLAGKSLIRRAAETLSEVECVDVGIISTDDEEMRDEAVRYGLEAPFMRPEKLSDDKATSTNMWQHAWLESEKYYDRRFDISVLLEPTSPMRTAGDIVRTVKLLVSTSAGAAATVSLTPAHYSPHKTLTISEEGVIGFYKKNGENYARRQDVPNFYHRNGVCYAVTRETLLETGMIIEKDCAALVIDRTVVNIDEPEDLLFAEYLMEKLTSN